MQPKVQILSPCSICHGEAYLPDVLVTCDDGSKRLTYKTCLDCGGSGYQKIWIELYDLLEMSAKHYQRDPLESNWLALSQEKLLSAYQDTPEAAGR